MDIPPTYQLTKKIILKLNKIEKCKTELYLLPGDIAFEKYSRQKSVLKSSLYSARIEGNPHTIEELEKSGWTDQKEKHKLEIANLYQALEYILAQDWKADVTIDDLKKLHTVVMKGLHGEAGSLRSEPSAIYNSAGIAVYVCPLPHEIRELLSQFLVYCNQDFESLIPIKAALAHVMFEKIHPFLDGNGRLGRLLIHLLFKKWEYDLRGLVPIEEYLEQHRQTYYDLLCENKSDRTEFVEFFLDGLIVSLEQALENKRNTVQNMPEDLLSLPPRRFEILNIIRDHQSTSYDFIKRRFINIPDRTLRYDLHELVKGGYIIRRGVTRGSVYERK
jgi:Fic family protein